MNRQRLALGTVQFGMTYGVANRSGRMARTQAKIILEQAWAAGINSLDTAVAYGESEMWLGEIGVAQWRIVSKLPEMPDSCPDTAAWAESTVLDSLKRLRVTRLHGLLLHHPLQLLQARGDALYMALLALKDQGLVEKTGVSVYAPADLDALCSRFPFDLVQAPLNIFDRRMVESGWLSRLRRAGTEIHIRSVFLQGLLLMKAEDRPPVFERWRPLWSQWHQWLKDRALTPLQACMGYVMAQPLLDRVIVGVDSPIQLQEILAAAGAPGVTPPATLSCDEQDLINPSRWKLL